MNFQRTQILLVNLSSQVLTEILAFRTRAITVVTTAGLPAVCMPLVVDGMQLINK